MEGKQTGYLNSRHFAQTPLLRSPSTKRRRLSYLHLGSRGSTRIASDAARTSTGARGYGPRFSAEINGNKREKPAFHENLQEASSVLTEITESPRKPPGIHKNMSSRNPVLQFPFDLRLRTGCHLQTFIKPKLSYRTISHYISTFPKLYNVFEVGVGMPRGPQ